MNLAKARQLAGQLVVETARRVRELRDSLAVAHAAKWESKKSSTARGNANESNEAMAKLVQMTKTEENDDFAGRGGSHSRE